MNTHLVGASIRNNTFLLWELEPHGEGYRPVEDDGPGDEVLALQILLPTLPDGDICPPMDERHEELPLDFHTVYGREKASAELLCLIDSPSQALPCARHARACVHYALSCAADGLFIPGITFQPITTFESRARLEVLIESTPCCMDGREEIAGVIDSLVELFTNRAARYLSNRYPFLSVCDPSRAQAHWEEGALAHFQSDCHLEISITDPKDPSSDVWTVGATYGGVPIHDLADDKAAMFAFLCAKAAVRELSPLLQEPTLTLSRDATCRLLAADAQLQESFTTIRYRGLAPAPVSVAVDGLGSLADHMVSAAAGLSVDGQSATILRANGVSSSEGTAFVRVGASIRKVDPQELRRASAAIRSINRAGLPRILAAVLAAGAPASIKGTPLRASIPPSNDKETTALLNLLNKRVETSDSIPGFCGELKSHQPLAIHWMAGLIRRGFGPLLADEMGLGKTISLIGAVLLDLQSDPADKGHILILCPKSVACKWVSELERFAPDLPVHPLTAANHRLPPLDGPFRIIVTTYDLLARRAVMFSRLQLRGIIADEAHVIRNSSSGRSMALRSLRSIWRIASTGTPLQNGIEDLWTIFDFLARPLMGTIEEFRHAYGRQPTDPDSFGRLRAAIEPFTLRRTKDQVASHIPAKSIRVVRLAPTPEQVTLYAEACDMALRDFEGQRSEATRHTAALRAIHGLKLICDHPAAKFSGGCLFGRSHKFDTCIDLALDITGSGESVVIFTQYRAPLALLQTALTQKGRQVITFEGRHSAAKRQEAAERFNSGRSLVFLISLHAGNTGFDAIGASSVIHFDRWWNPAVEAQATDRVHRIGQTKSVTVHIPIVKGTVEERIDMILKAKAGVADSLLTGTGHSFGRLTLTEFANLIKIAA